MVEDLPAEGNFPRGGVRLIGWLDGEGMGSLFRCCELESTCWKSEKKAGSSALTNSSNVIDFPFTTKELETSAPRLMRWMRAARFSPAEPTHRKTGGSPSPPSIFTSAPASTKVWSKSVDGFS